MDTSGLLIVAKNDFAHQALAEQLKDHSLSRVYEAIVVGNMRQDSGTINAPIGRHPIDRKKMAVTEKNSRPAVTHYEVIARYPRLHPSAAQAGNRTNPSNSRPSCLAEPPHCGRHGLWPGQGVRSHQPVPSRQKPDLPAPRTGELTTVTCELPEYFTSVLKKLGASVD